MEHIESDSLELIQTFDGVIEVEPIIRDHGRML
jgi:hypothetical protein